MAITHSAEGHTLNEPLPEVYLARHGETAWSLSGRHTGRTDIPLTERGESNARKLRGRLEGLTFTEVLVSPLQRARRTCELAGFEAVAKVTPELMEWDYGDYEGRLTADIRLERPGWGDSWDDSSFWESSTVAPPADRVAYLEGIIARWKGSGLRQAEFCSWHGLAPGSLNTWRCTPRYREALERYLAASAQQLETPRRACSV